jgi:hypothetical protein
MDPVPAIPYDYNDAAVFTGIEMPFLADVPANSHAQLQQMKASFG